MPMPRPHYCLAVLLSACGANAPTTPTVDADTDLGAVDSGLVDSGLLDSGSLDSGPLDSSPLDSGPLDSGPDAPAPDRPVALDAPVDAPAPDRPVVFDAPVDAPRPVDVPRDVPVDTPADAPVDAGPPRVGVWTPMAAPPPQLVGRSAHTAVWTGTEMIVFGGQNAFVGAARLDTGARYNPATDTWRMMSTMGARARARHTAVWTGRVMLVWGGRPNDSDSPGEAYDPATDTWTSLARAGVPAARTSGHSAVWTGSEMIVWGGLAASFERFNTGARYDPVRDRWTPVSMVNAPSARGAHAAVWTGTEMLVWGGGSTSTLGDGAAYDPVRDVWRPLAQTGAPTARLGASTEWTGTEMIVWGGGGGADLGGVERRNGGRYDPRLDRWTLFETGTSRSVKQNASVWTGTEMVVWGGSTGSSPEVYLEEGAAYAPATGRLTLLPSEGAPSRRTSPTAVWSGSEMLLWGGYLGTSVATSGARYRP